MREITKNLFLDKIWIILATFIINLFLCNVAFCAQNQEANACIFVIFRNDDLSALSDFKTEERILKIFEKYNFPQTFGVIPNRGIAELNQKAADQYKPLIENPDIVELLRKYQKKGLIEIALHGYAHQRDSKGIKETVNQLEIKFFPILTKNKDILGEFKGLSYEEQLNKIKSGKDMLEKWLDIPIITFIAPSNAHDGNTLKAAQDAGIKIFSSVFNNSSYNNFNNYPNMLLTDVLSDVSLSFGNVKKNLLAAYAYIKKNNFPVVISVYYHSLILKERDLVALEDTLRTLAQAPNVRVMTLSGIYSEDPGLLQKIYQSKWQYNINQKTKKINRVLNFFRMKKYSMSGFDVTDPQYYKKLSNYLNAVNFLLSFTYLIFLLFIYIVSFLFGIAISRLFIFFVVLVSKSFKINKCIFFLVLVSVFFSALFFLVIMNSGAYKFEPGIGSLDLIFIFSLFGFEAYLLNKVLSY